MPKTQTTQSLTLERTYKQSPDKVWAAWTSPAALRDWFYPGDVASVSVERFEPRKGGALRVQFGPGPMGTPTAVGTFTDVVPGKRLAFTWNWEGAPAMPDSLVTIEMAKAGAGTKVTLRHDGLPTREAADHHNLGWTGILDRYTLLLDPMANKDVVRRFIEQGAAKNDAKAIDATVSASFVWHTPMPGAPPTRDGVKASIIGFRQAFPDYQLKLLDLLGDGDKVVSRVQFTGTNQGPVMGMPATGKKVSLEFWHIERIVDGKIQERWNVMDNLAFMQQLGMAK
ncbi:MAG: hypothetical protein QOI63_750 [Thermoplasmata archaeon]|jgi:uncharacterized protein YndB with AHSA1/START domain/predicted ester cyclase|nr:hypothetical protein [Thermoplasmata archaeon]